MPATDALHAVAEIDLLFEQRTPARKFATTVVDVYDDKDHLIAQANAAVRESELS